MPGEGPVPPARDVPAWRIAAAAREPDQAGRLGRFMDAHPGVLISRGEARTMRALIPGDGGTRHDGREVFGYTLRELLGKLDRIFPPDVQDSG